MQNTDRHDPVFCISVFLYMFEYFCFIALGAGGGQMQNTDGHYTVLHSVTEEYTEKVNADVIEDVELIFRNENANDFREVLKKVKACIQPQHPTQCTSHALHVQYTHCTLHTYQRSLPTVGIWCSN